MKKLAIVIVLFILFSCHPQLKISYVFDKSYKQTELTVLQSDFKEQLEKYGLSLADTGKWNSVQYDTDNGQIKQRFITKQDNKTTYVFIYSAILEKDSLFYEFKIRQEK